MSGQSLRNTVQNSEAAHTDITLPNAQKSPLLRLPPELRNKIYVYVFGCLKMSLGGSSEDRGIWYTFSQPIDAGRFVSISKTRPTAPLMLSCRQIYTETELLPFRLNQIKLVNQHALFHATGGLTDRERNAIRTIRTRGDWSSRVLSELGTPEWSSPDPILDHGTFLPLARLGGLECVVWEQDVTPEGKRKDSRSDEDIREWVLQIGGHDGWKICVEKVVVYR